MAAASRPKASDKQGICKKLLAILKKRYKSLSSVKSRPVLESMVYAVCLEDSTVEQADAAFARLYASFHDLNEIRVSSVTEVTTAFEGMPHPEWRAIQVRGLLQYIFEKNFAFEFEGLRKKTLELAQKQLSKIRDLSPFVRAWTLQEALGSHMVPMDGSMTRACLYLGLVDIGSNEEQASTAMRPVLRKNEAQTFCELLRAFGTDPSYQRTLEQAGKATAEEGYELATAPSRLTKLFGSEGDVEAPKSPKEKAKPSRKPAAASKAKEEKASKSKPSASKSDSKTSKKRETSTKSTRPRSRTS